MLPSVSATTYWYLQQNAVVALAFASGETGSVPPVTVAKVPKVPQTPSAPPVEVRGAEARCSRFPLVATPLGSVPVPKARFTVVEVEYVDPVPTRPVAVMEPPVGPVTSAETFTTFALVPVAWLPTLSATTYWYW